MGKRLCVVECCERGSLHSQKTILIIVSEGSKDILGSKDISENDSDEVKKEKLEYNARLKEALERQRDVVVQEDITYFWDLSESDRRNLSLNAKAKNRFHNALSLGNLISVKMVVARNKVRKMANQIKPTLALKSTKSLDESPMEDEDDKDDEIDMMTKQFNKK
ncbi:hypothetical protein LIER_25549 [Lithospermum erythrorhizon]|uniref:Ycf1 n=1 Tax=Lithospermum erythrorhizon TaxID=34254 RepID=A0AAV3R9I0_LITER